MTFICLRQLNFSKRGKILFDIIESNFIRGFKIQKKVIKSS